MSEMVANKGIIREVYPELKDLRQKLESLAYNLDIKLTDLVNEKGLEDNEAWFNSKYWNDYTVIGDRLFDTTSCPDLYDYESEHEDTMKKISNSEYQLDFYYYNGGTNMEEIFDELVEKADAEYESKDTNKVFYALKKSNGNFVTGAGNSSLTTPRLYLTEENAHKAMKQWPGINYNYEVVKFAEIKE